MAGYNRTRYVEQLLEKTEFLPPSFTVHLHSEYWVLNNGSKFLYNNQIASLLDDIRAHRIPVDFIELFDSARVPFYEGCMIVELLDYRPQKSNEPALKNPDKTRVVLHPSPETLWADICSLNQHNGGRWTDIEALEIEAKFLLATSQPLCLDPDPHLTRIVNNVVRVSTPSMPLSLKRKSSAMEPEEDGPEKAKRERLLGFMAPRDNRLHAPSYRLLDAIEMNKQKKEASKTSVANQHGHQYLPASSQSVQPVPPQPLPPQPQPTPTPQPTIPAPAAAHSPQDHGEMPAQTIDTPQTFNVPFRPNGAHTPVPQPTHQYSQHPSAATLQSIQPQVYANLQAAQEAAIKRASTPAQPQQIQAYQQHYMQPYPYPQQFQQQQQQPHQTATQPHLPRPPSQPQHLQTPQPATQTLPSPQPPTQQLNPQLAQPQRYTQTPKPPQVQPTTIQPTQTQQQQPNASASPYQGAVTDPRFGQPAASAVRPIQRPQSQPGSIQHPQMTLPTSANPSHLYNPQLQQQGQPSLQQQQAQQLYMRQTAAAPGGRTTPAQTQRSPRVQPQTAQPNRTMTATPSPAKGSPVVHHPTIGTPIQPRASPMQTKAQIPIQPSGSGQSLPAMGQQSQPTQQAQQPSAQQLNPGGIQMPPQRYQFQSQYGPLRPLVHGNQQLIVPGGTGTPTMAHASPVVGGRPLTPADGKPQQTQINQAQQQPIRRPTPLQQQTPAAIPQMPTHLVKQQTPQPQPQQVPQSQQSQAQGQQMQAQAQPSPQVQQANLAVQQQQSQHQNMNTYAQIYGFTPYWRVPVQQQQQGQGQQGGSATPVQLPQSMSPQQRAQYQYHLQIMMNQIQQSPVGQRLNPQQLQTMAHSKLMQAAQTQPSVGQVGVQQVQGGQSAQQPATQPAQSQQHQMNSAQMQAMMGKMQMQMGPQIHMQQGHVQGVVGGQSQTANMLPAQMHMPHFQQTQHHSPIPQPQHVGQQKAKPTAAAKKGPAGR